METIFLRIGCSYTLAKILPYAITLLVGIIFLFVFRKKIGSQHRMIRIPLKVFVFVFPFSLYFGFHPIYQGDFSDEGEMVIKTDNMKEITGNSLVVLVIPNCPYCRETIKQLLLMKERNPSMTIEYIICGTDLNNINWYRTATKRKINLHLANNLQGMFELAGGSFPAFILSKEKTNILMRWTNNEFGVRALDKIERILN